MSNSQIATNIGKLVNNSSKLVGTLQIGVNTILWGVVNTQPVQSTYTTTSGSLAYSSSIPDNPTPPKANLINSGLFNALDALNKVDLCSVMTYVTDNINFKKTPKSKRPPVGARTAAQASLYALQDSAELVQTYIDKYTAYPNIYIGSYLGTGPNAVPQNIAVTQSGAPSEGGQDIQKYNMYFLMQSIKDTFSFESTSSIFTAEDQTLLTTVPGLGGNLNIVDDFIGTINKYSDYRQISNADLQKLQNKITTLRSVCVTIQNLDFKNALALAGNFLGTDIRAQIQQLSKFINPTGITKELRDINSSLQTFIRQARQVQGILATGQFLIKLALIFNKVFKFIQEFITNAPIPATTQTTGTISRLEKARITAKDETDGITRLLKSVNTLLSVVVLFIRYLLTNTNELLSRLEVLLATLEGCQAVQDSDVLYELNRTKSNLIVLQEQLATYITQYDSKTNTNSTTFGVYDIRVVDEELTDKSIQNKRRRGIALDQAGNIVTNSALTYATNTAVIIAEVQQKLMALGLVKSGIVQIDATNLALIVDSINYLDSNDILQGDLNIDAPITNEAASANISSFLDGLPGGVKFKQNSQSVISAYTANAATQTGAQTNAQITALSGSGPQR
jgi:hypothetical protein